ncbi:ATPase, T2SS/T4P/T4SS family [Providencia vermicola]|uniref:ATPase, T2SS/T4P/T4SS family n=1 Tax=Providencia vermicola TaxID=333965 RepID=UPI0034DCF83A
MMTTREQDFIFKELKSVCDKHYIIIVDYNNKRLSIGVPKKPHDNVLATLRFIAGVPVCYDIWPKEKIDHYFNKKYAEIQEPETVYHSQEKEQLAITSPAVDFAENMLKAAVRKRASDIHIEPTKQGLKIRLRVDGKLYFIPSPPLEINNEIIARIKILERVYLCSAYFNRPTLGAT